MFSLINYILALCDLLSNCFFAVALFLSAYFYFTLRASLLTEWSEAEWSRETCFGGAHILSGYMISSSPMTLPQPLSGIVHFFVISLVARYSAFKSALSLGNTLLCLFSRRYPLFRLSMAWDTPHPMGVFANLQFAEESCR